MGATNDESDLSDAPSTSINPFSIAAASVASTKVAKHTRNIHTRRPVISSAQASQKRRTLKTATPQPSDDHRALADVPIEVPERSQELEVAFEPSEDSASQHRPETPSNQSQASESSSAFKRPRPKSSHIHQHSRMEGGVIICNRCNKRYKLSGGTGGMIRHLKVEHSIDPEASSIAEKRIRDGTAIDAAILRGIEINREAEEERRKELMGIGLDKETLEYLYLQWTVDCDIAFKHVRNKNFRAFLEYVNPVANRMLPDSDSTIKSHAEGLFAEGKERLRHILATAISDIHITCDMWTSPNHLGLLVVVAHFTGEDLKLHAVTLGLKELEGDHSGQNQAVYVLIVLEDFGIRNKLGYMVMDNAASNNQLIATVATTLNQEGVFYDAQQRRLRCNGHVINLAVQAFLFGKTVDDYEFPENLTDSPSDVQLNQWRKLGPLGKLHNIIVWIMGSPQRIQSFRDRTTQGYMPHRDNSTRWNSWYDMLDWAIKKIKAPIIAVSNEEPELSTDLLSAEEWRTLNHIRDFLQAFHDATKATEGRAATLDGVLPSMDFLCAQFEYAIEEFAHHDFMRESLHAGLTKLLKYWNKTERAPAYIAAIVLNPRKKWKYFKRWNPHWQPNMEVTMKRFWETTYRSSTGLARYASSTRTPHKPSNNQYFKWLNDQDDEAEDSNDALDEFDLYISDHFILREEDKDKTALEWWVEPEQRTRYPLLSKMAIDIYSIPAMSSEAERVFSGAKRSISDSRGSLKSETIELLECLKSWFRLGIFTKEDLHAIVTTMEEGVAEELEIDVE